jgi:sulfur transfer protein SufE
MDYPTIFSEMASELSMIPTQKEKLEYIMDFGKGMDELEKDKRTDENFVPGCISKVYIDCSIENEIISFKGYSDSLIVKGYVRILCEAFSGIERKEFMDEGKEHIERFVKESRIIDSLLPSRANTFGNIFVMMQKKAS